VDLNSQVSRDLSLRAFYTYSRSIDSAADTRGPGGADLSQTSNPYLGWRYDIGPSGFDRTHNAAFNFIYDIPVFRNNSSRLVKTVAGGWSVSGIVTIESGVPIDIGTGGPQGSDGLPNAKNRPDRVGNISYTNAVLPGDHHIQYFDPSAFALPALGAFGNLGHYALRGPGRDNWNLSLFKSFVFSETRGSRLEFRVETFNVWNHTQFNQVSNNFANGDFGQYTSAFDPRILQFGLKLYF